MPRRQGAIRLFRFAGIDVFLHWSWFVVAIYEIQMRANGYASPFWNAIEYLALFGIVTVHEFGHALACRSTGGRAEQIVLWPLGGVALVNPPQRPGATLWSIAAGPLVNVVLLPVLFGADYLVGSSANTASDPARFVHALAWMNLVLLVFNVLPIYPLDGGQILRSLLWFFLGRSTSLTAVVLIGFVGALGLFGFALLSQSPWFGIMALFVAFNCWQGLQQARALARVAKIPRREGYRCPSCGAAPPIGEFWGCGACRGRFDAFETPTACPSCGARFERTLCVDCGRPYPLAEWASPGAVEGSGT
jgi:Zn-dependent protease